MKMIAIQDASILIDLVKTGLFRSCLSLEYDFATTDLILEELHEEQRAILQTHINSGEFGVIESNETELEAILEMSLVNPKLSHQDCSVVHFAILKNALILTGDKRLRSLAENKGLKTGGFLWILDELITTKAFLKQDACRILKDLMTQNNRLPKEECEARIKAWSDQ